MKGILRGLVVATGFVAFACGDSGQPTDVEPGLMNITITNAGSAANDAGNDGFTLIVDGVTRQRVLPTTSIVDMLVSPGEHVVSLGDVEFNTTTNVGCTIDTTHPAQVTIGQGESGAVSFGVTCI